MITANSITNEERAEFLRKLDKSELIVTDWEADFIASFLRAYRWWNWFTPGRVGSCDKMIVKYGREPEIAFNFPMQETKTVKIPEADPNGCEFLTYETFYPKPCNAPATKMRKNGFRYCTPHGDEVQLHAKRRGMAVTLFAFNHQDTKTPRP
ncbi:MAG TPA: hypothetical protein VHX90_01220 [Verrucomicrobiae bacterium]|jgi:hypothetical protein|nr:hypothetical protein [Verrucomicrobiae bacterium]